AVSRIFILDSSGLAHYASKKKSSALAPYVKSEADIKGWKVLNQDFISLLDVVKNGHPTVLIGVSGQSGVFTKEIIQEMHKKVKRPIIFPLSNPTSKTEAVPQDILEWTNGDAIVATGSPFAPVTIGGKTVKI